MTVALHYSFKFFLVVNCIELIHFADQLEYKVLHIDISRVLLGRGSYKRQDSDVGEKK